MFVANDIDGGDYIRELNAVWERAAVVLKQMHPCIPTWTKPDEVLQLGFVNATKGWQVMIAPPGKPEEAKPIRETSVSHRIHAAGLFNDLVAACRLSHRNTVAAGKAAAKTLEKLVTKLEDELDIRPN